MASTVDSRAPKVFARVFLRDDVDALVVGVERVEQRAELLLVQRQRIRQLEAGGEGE